MSIGFRLVQSLAFVGSVACGGAIAQDRDSEYYREFRPVQVALNLHTAGDLIAVGTFGAPVEIGSDPASLIRSREMDLDFTVSRVVLGNIPPGGVVTVRLRIDMLEYPGEAISRYEKRQQLIDRLNEPFQVLTAEADQIEAAFARGEIRGSERTRLLQELDERNGPFLAEAQELMSTFRMVVTSHGATFYDLHTAISANKPYLVVLRSIEGNPRYYFLSETSSPIWWGDAADDVISEFESLSDSGLAIR